MLTYDIEKRDRPLYEFLYINIREDIKEGKIKPREKLPSKRVLAEHLGVSVITVQNAYEQLLSEGYITSRQRGGYFAADLGEFSCEDRKKAINYREEAKKVIEKSVNDPQKAIMIDLASLAPDPSLFPFSVWSRLMRRVLSEQDEKLLNRVPGIGVKQLRQAISDHLFHFRGMYADPDCIVVGAGTEYLYNLLLQLLGDRVYAIEDPGYKKIASILELCRIPYIPTPIDEYGMIPDIAPEADVFHISPSHHFPTGAVMPAPRRRELLRLASEREGYIIEDDYDSEFRFDGKPVPTLFGEDETNRVIYINTFSETISPSIRISYMILPRALMDEFDRRLNFYSCTVPSFEQYTLAAFISEGYFEKHINRMRLRYREKRDLAVEALKELDCGIEVISPTAGLGLLLRLETEKNDEYLEKVLLSQGIRISFVSDYLYSENKAYEHLALVNFVRARHEDIVSAVAVLAEIL